LHPTLITSIEMKGMFLTQDVIGKRDKLHGQLTIIDVYRQKDNCELLCMVGRLDVWREESTPS